MGGQGGREQEGDYKMGEAGTREREARRGGGAGARLSSGV